MVYNPNDPNNKFGNPSYDQSNNRSRSNPDPYSSTAPDYVYSPDVEGAFGYSGGKLDDYFSTLEKPQDVPSLTGRLEDVNYNKWDWQLPEYQAAQREGTTYSQPQIDDLERVGQMVDQQYMGQESKQFEQIGKDYGDVEKQMQQELLLGRSRPEQAAALMANLGMQESSARQAAQRDIGFEQASQNINIGQTEQALAQQRSQQLAQLGLTAEQLQQMERQQAYESAEDQSRYGAGMDQWLQEQRAAEEQSQTMFDYGKAQDLTQAELQQYETQRTADLDYSNAMLQGQQAASQQAGQLGTYHTNLTEDERKKSQQYQDWASANNAPSSPNTSYAQTYQMPQQSSYASTLQSGTPSTPSYSTTQNYQMPTQQMQTRQNQMQQQMNDLRNNSQGQQKATHNIDVNKQQAQHQQAAKQATALQGAVKPNQPVAKKTGYTGGQNA